MENPKTENDDHDPTSLRNILILSFGTMLLMAAYLPTVAIEQTILQSVQVDDPTFTGDGYLSQSIVNFIFSLTNFLAPTIISLVGVRTTLVLGTCVYTVFISSFLYPNSILLYASSALIGFGAANVWVANGIIFTKSSNKDNIGTFVGLYWAIISLGQLIGHGFIFWRFQGINHIDPDTRSVVISVLTILAILSTVTFAFLGKPKAKKKILDPKRKSILASITQPFRLLGNKHMLLLIPPSLYNGMEIAFFTAIYPTSVAFTEAFGGDTRKLVGVAGILIGLGSLTGGLVFGMLIAKFVNSKRTCIVICSCIAHVTSFALMYLNLPNAAPLGPTQDTSWMNPPSIPIAMFCAFLLGIGDGCISTQIIAAIGVIWPEDPSSATALYRFFQAATCAAGYFIGTLTGLYNQVLVFLGLTLFGTFTFIVNERLIAKIDRRVE